MEFSIRKHEIRVAMVAKPKQLDQDFKSRLVQELGVGMKVVRYSEGRLKIEEVNKRSCSVIVLWLRFSDLY